MALQTVETQIIRDDDRYVTVKVRGIASGAWSTNATIVQANTLFGANASVPIIPLSLTDIKFTVDTGGPGYVDLQWTANNGSQTNVSILSFATAATGEWNGFSIQNNANTPTGDVCLQVNGFAAGNGFSFILTFVKDQTFQYSNINYGAIAWANTMNAYNNPWS